MRELVDASFQGVKRLFGLAYNNGANRLTVDFYQRYFLPMIKTESYHIDIDGIIDLTKQYDEVKKYQQDKVMIIRLVVY